MEATPTSPPSQNKDKSVTFSHDHDHTKHKLCGMLRKQSMGSGRWRRRFFVLSDTELAYVMFEKLNHIPRTPFYHVNILEYQHSNTTLEHRYYKSADATVPRFRIDLKDLKAVTKRRDRPNDERFFEIHVMERQVPLQVCAESVEEASRWRRTLSECANPDAKFLPLHAGPIKWARQSIFHNKMHSEEKVPTFESDIVEKVASTKKESTTTTTTSEKISDNQIIPESSFDPDLFGSGDENTFGNVDDSIGTLILDEKLCGRLRRKLQIRWMNSKLPSMGSWVQSPEDLPDAFRDGFLLFQLLQELSPLEAESSRYLMLEKANTKKTQIKNIEVSLRILHASRRIRCTNLPDANTIQQGRPKMRIHRFLREICDLYEMRKINVTRCLTWWNDVLERHPYTKPILPTSQVDWKYAMRGTQS